MFKHTLSNVADVVERYLAVLWLKIFCISYQPTDMCGWVQCGPGILVGYEHIIRL